MENNNHNTFINVKTGKIQKIHPDFVNDKVWQATHNLMKHTEPKPAEVTNLVPQEPKKIIDFSTEPVIEPAPIVEPVIEPTKKSNSKTK